MPLFMHIGYELYTFFQSLFNWWFIMEAYKGQNEAEILVTHLPRRTY